MERQRRKNRKVRSAALLLAVLLGGALPLSTFAESQEDKAGLADILENTQEESPDSQAGQAGLSGLAGLVDAEQSEDTSGVESQEASDAAENPSGDAEEDSSDQVTVEVHEKKAVTVMIYLCGSNLESEGGAATADIAEMLRSKYNTDEVNVLAMAGGSSKWRSGFSADETAIYEISGSRPTKVYGEGLMNMGEPETLETLLSFCQEYYPAERYALDLWDHGGGPMNGVCWDSLAGSDNLTMSELQQALDNSFCREEPLEWIGFDACLMATVETAYLVSPYARYMIASEETEPGSGWSYSFLNGIENDANGGETGRRIVEAYFAETKSASASQLTLSCIDLSRIDSVQDQMDQFFSELDIDLTEETFSQISNMRQGARGFGRAASGSQDYDLVDLIDLTQHYAAQNETGAQSLLDALEQAVVYSDSTIEGSHGLAVYHPYYNKELYSLQWETEYAGFFFSPGYTQYIGHFARILMGEEMGDWSRMMPSEQSEDEEKNMVFSLQLTEDQRENFASAQMLVLGDENDHDYMFGNAPGYSSVYVSDEVTMDENGVLSATYAGKSLYVVDEDGQPITKTINYWIVDGKIRIFVMYGDDFLSEGVLSYLSCEEVEESDELRIVDQYFLDEITGQWTNRIELDTSVYDKAFLIIREMKPTYEDGRLLAFADWESAGNLAAEAVPNSGEMQIAFIEEQLTDQQRYVTFQVADTQGNVHSSELQEVENGNITPLVISPAELKEEDWTIEVSGHINNSPIEPDLAIEFVFNNLGEELIKFRLSSLKINGSRSLESSYSTGYLDMEESGWCRLSIDPVDLVNIEQVFSLDGILEIEIFETEEIEVPFHLKLENGAVPFSQKVEERILAEDSWRGITCQLVDFYQQDDGKYYTLFHWINDTDEERSLYLDCALNGRYQVESYYGLHVDLRANSECWREVEISGRVDRFSSSDYHLKQAGLLNAYGETEISSLSLFVSGNITYGESLKRFQLDLEEPVPVEAAEPEELNGTVILSENLEITLYRAEVLDEDYENSIIMLMDFENKSGKDLEVSFYSWDDGTQINGMPASVSAIFDTMLKDSITRQYISVEQWNYLVEEGEEQVNAFDHWQIPVMIQFAGGVTQQYILQFSVEEPRYLRENAGYQIIPLEEIQIEAMTLEEWKQQSASDSAEPSDDVAEQTVLYAESADTSYEEGSIQEKLVNAVLDTEYSYELTAEEQEKFASAQMVVYGTNWYSSRGSYMRIHYSGELQPDEEGVLHGIYTGTGLYAFDSEGNQISGVLTYWIEDGMYVIPAYCGDYLNGYTETVRFLYEKEEESNVLIQVGMLVWDEEAEEYVEDSELDLSIYDYYYIRTQRRIPVYEGEELLSFAEWESDGNLNTQLLPAKRAFTLQLVDEELSSMQKYVTFALTDIEGNVHYTPFQSVANPNLQLLGTARCEEAEWSLDISTVRDASACSEGIAFLYDLENQDEDAWYYEIMATRINDTRVIDNTIRFSPEFEESSQSMLILDSNDLMGIGEITSVEFVLQSYDWEDEMIMERTIHLEVEDAVHSPKNAGDILAEDTFVDVTCQLSALVPREDGTIFARFHWINHSSEDVELYLNGAVNGLLQTDTSKQGESEWISFHSGLWPEIPANSECYTSAVLTDVAEEPSLYHGPQMKQRDLFERYGITEVTSLILYQDLSMSGRDNSVEGAARFVLNLQEPVALTLQEMPEIEEGFAILTPESDIEVNLMRAEIQEEDGVQYMSLLLELDNTGRPEKVIRFDPERKYTSIGQTEGTIVAGDEAFAMLSDAKDWIRLTIADSNYNSYDDTPVIEEFQDFETEMRIQNIDGEGKIYRLQFHLEESQKLSGNSEYHRLSLDEIQVTVTEIH